MIPVNTPLISGNEKKYLMECIETGWISSEGPFVEKFEEKFSSYIGRRFGVSVTNGTAALEAAVCALNLPKNSEVIVPTFTIISCAAAIIRNGLIPIPVDCDLKTFNASAENISEAITEKTSAIMVVHIYGMPCDMDAILKIADKHKLKVIEDAAEVIGQEYKGKKCGTFGDISTFSFYPNKHITTGEGGMVLTDDKKISSHLKSLRNLCFKPEKRFVHDELGWNFRMTNLQAALGLAQLEQIENFLIKKRFIGKAYNNNLKDLEGINLPLSHIDYAENIYWVYSIVLNKDLNLKAQSVMKSLNDEGIGTRPFFYPLHKQPVLSPYFKTRKKFKNSEFLSEYGFYLPSGLGLKENEIDIVCKKLKKIIES